MNRFFRSAFFPLIVIVLLVWLASQTLIPKNHHTRKETYSGLRTQVLNQPASIKSIEFAPSKRAITATYNDAENTTATVHYPTDQSELDFEQLLQKQKVQYDSKGTGGFSWTALIGSSCPSCS